MRVRSSAECTDRSPAGHTYQVDPEPVGPVFVGPEPEPGQPPPELDTPPF